MRIENIIARHLAASAAMRRFAQDPVPPEKDEPAPEPPPEPEKEPAAEPEEPAPAEPKAEEPAAGAEPAKLDAVVKAVEDLGKKFEGMTELLEGIKGALEPSPPGAGRAKEIKYRVPSPLQPNDWYQSRAAAIAARVAARAGRTAKVVL